MPGDGIGCEIAPQALKVLKALGLDLEFGEAAIGGAGLDSYGGPLPTTRARSSSAPTTLR